MTIQPWRATCIQMTSKVVTTAATHKDAWVIIEQNVDRAIQLINQALDGAEPPKLVVLPEFALQGPPRGELVNSWMEKACDTIPGRATERLQALAAERGIYIAGNLFETDPKWPGRFFNSCFLIGDKGEILLRYRRINTALWPSPHDFMDDYLAEMGPEGTFPVVDTPLGRLAMVACGEISVPEVARVFMMRGAEVILHPTNEENSPGQEAAKVARAAENMVYLVSANVAGGIGFSADGSVVGGRSHILDYRARSVAFEPAAHETVEVSALIDVNALREARRDTSMANTLLRNRWEMYKPYFAEAAFYPPNEFLEMPMFDSAQTQPIAETALRNLTKAGVARS